MGYCIHTEDNNIKESLSSFFPTTNYWICKSNWLTPWTEYWWKKSETLFQWIDALIDNMNFLLAVNDYAYKTSLAIRCKENKYTA